MPKFDLERFVDAQAHSYTAALAELQAGRKRSHWMWYIFPQFAGLGLSATSQRYAIGSVAEAEAYLAHPLLGPRLKACAEALLAHESLSAHAMLGSPDDMKLKSCATLFAQLTPPGSVYDRLLTHYFDGERDQHTLALMANGP